MNKETFDKYFDHLVSEPLIRIDFKEEGKSVYLNDGQITVSLIRLGGKFSMAGTIAHILCFRHSFLPNLDEDISEGFEKEVFAYPYKWKPRDVDSMLKKPFKYKSQNLNYDYERFDFSKKSETETKRYLSLVHNAVLKITDWAKNTETEEIANQVKKYGESAWIEKLWLSAYSSRSAI